MKSEPMTHHSEPAREAVAYDVPEMLRKWGRVQLGIDGNAGFALLGPDLQKGEAEFVTIGNFNPDAQGGYVIPAGEIGAQLWACKRALKALCARLGISELPFYFGRSHPYGD